MPAVSDLYTRATAQVKALLDAVLLTTVTPTAGPLKEIVVEDWVTSWSSAEGVADFINRFMQRTPCGVISNPQETFRREGKPANARVADSFLNFNFMALIPDMRGSSTRRTTINSIRELAVSALSDIEITAEAGATYAFRPLELESAKMFDLATCAVFHLAFSIPVDTTLTSYT